MTMFACYISQSTVGGCYPSVNMKYFWANLCAGWKVRQRSRELYMWCCVLRVALKPSRERCVARAWILSDSSSENSVWEEAQWPKVTQIYNCACLVFHEEKKRCCHFKRCFLVIDQTVSPIHLNLKTRVFNNLKTRVFNLLWEVYCCVKANRVCVGKSISLSLSLY